MSTGHDQAAATLLGSLSSLVRTARAVAHRSSGELDATGTPLGVLKVLQAGDTRPGDLAAALQVAPSVVSRALVPLETRGLVQRTSDPADGRAALIGLTDLGRDRLAQLQDAYVDRVSDLLADWTDDEVEQAAHVLDRLERAMTEISSSGVHQRLVATALLPAPETPRPAPGVDDDATAPAPHATTRKTVDA